MVSPLLQITAKPEPKLSASQLLGAAQYVDQVVNVHKFLAKQSDCSPRNQALNSMLYGFVRNTMKKRDPLEVEAILAAPIIKKLAPTLRQLLSRAEYEMECYSARAMIGNEGGVEKAFSSYSNFLYRGNYEALVAAELQALKWKTKAPPIKADQESVAFVGAGPLPISAIMFHRHTGLCVTCIDSDEVACRLGRQLILHLAQKEPGYEGLDKAIHFVHKPGDEHDYVTHPIVFIASLIERKDPIVMRIVQTSHTVATTIVRSAEGLSTLLYQSEDTVAGQEFYNVYLVGRSKPSPQAINTSLIYKFPPGKQWRRNKVDWNEVAPTDDVHALKPQMRRGLWRTCSADYVI